MALHERRQPARLGSRKSRTLFRVDVCIATVRDRRVVSGLRFFRAPPGARHWRRQGRLGHGLGATR
ncbi:MAG: hypothetical protein EB110_11410, partial [Betaproteobacteria bacterium]|nr:hypothetical protein [Betaproteobacteria bacterium]